ncbi:MAG: hypothetical protein KDD58_15605 [Bdellovibrionales bacterium]|nr:hypothetical protein [Bdellovibrionales bacterium]
MFFSMIFNKCRWFKNGIFLFICGLSHFDLAIAAKNQDVLTIKACKEELTSYDASLPHLISQYSKNIKHKDFACTITSAVNAFQFFRIKHGYLPHKNPVRLVNRLFDMMPYTATRGSAVNEVVLMFEDLLGFNMGKDSYTVKTETASTDIHASKNSNIIELLTQESDAKLINLDIKSTNGQTPNEYSTHTVLLLNIDEKFKKLKNFKTQKKFKIVVVDPSMDSPKPIELSFKPIIINGTASIEVDLSSHPLIEEYKKTLGNSVQFYAYSVVSAHFSKN